MTDRTKSVTLTRDEAQMTFSQFHNALRILTSIDRHELIDAGVITLDDGGAWQQFRMDPFRWFIRTDDNTARKLWQIIEARQ